MAIKTNAMRLLTSAKIKFEVKEYEVDESDLSGQTLAKKISFPEEQVFKTLVLRGEKRGIIVCLVPVSSEINLKALAKTANDKKVEMILMKDLLPLTGYIRGGVSPIGQKKKYPTFVDSSALLFDVISISAGVRGCQILINPTRLINFTNATICDII